MSHHPSSLPFNGRLMKKKLGLFLSTLGWQRVRAAFLDLGLGLLAGLAGALFAGFGRVDFTAPLRPTQDYVFALFHIKTLLAFGDVHRNPALGFPGELHLEAFPLPDGLGHLIARALALFTDNPMTILLDVLVVCFIGLGLSTYGAVRASGYGRGWAFISGFLFASSAHMVERAHVHPWFCVMFALPWVMRLCLLTPYQGARLGARPLRLSIWGALIAGIAAGSSGIYWAFFAAFYLALALLLFAALKVDRAKLKPLALALAGTLGSFLLLTLPLMIVVWQKGETFPNRNLFFQPLYGLRLPDVFVPAVPGLTRFYDVFHQLQNARSDEGNYQVLGLWGLMGVLYGLAVCLRRLVPNRAPRLIRREPLLRLGVFYILIGILFAVPYGLGFVFNQVVNGVIRAQVRIGAFFFPVALMMTPPLWQALRKRLDRRLWVVLIGLVVLVTNAPLFQAVARDQAATLPLWHERRASLTNTLQALDRERLMRVAQYPSIYLPEGPATPTFGNTDYLWPAILDSSSGRKYSFGSMVFEANWARLARLMREPTDDWLRDLSLMGYDSILVEKDALMNDDARLVARLREPAWRSGVVYEDDARLVYRIPHVID
jgi:hypothetical protein